MLDECCFQSTPFAFEVDNVNEVEIYFKCKTECHLVCGPLYYYESMKAYVIRCSIELLSNITRSYP